jgi:starch-binding outer membrane protein, SusD/RagB family
MKKRLLILLIAITTVTVSCGDDFTLLAPISDRNVENFYQTDTDFIVAINGAYESLADNDAYGRNYVLLVEMRGDNTDNGGGNTGLAEEFFRLNTFNELATSSVLSSAWAGAYRGIARTNTILSRLENVDLSSTDLEDRIRGEALFIRGLLYYNLATIFGNVPLQLEEVTSTEVEIVQVTPSDVYAQIASDMQVAATLLPVSYSDAGDIGRVTRGAALTLQGLAELSNGNNSTAEGPLREVVNSNQYDLVENYSDIWGPDNENNEESVFEIQYKAGGTGTGSGFTEFYTPFGTSGGVGGGNAPQVISDAFLTIYDDEDDRFWGGSVDSTDEGGVYSAKYVDTPFDQFDADNNFIVFRYADVLLMLAEAVGDTPEGWGLINEVRERSGLIVPAETLGETFEDVLLLERQREFAHENKRWPDLLRFDRAAEVMSVQLGIPESDVRLLFPIPQREIDVSGGRLTQNPL